MIFNFSLTRYRTSTTNFWSKKAMDKKLISPHWKQMANSILGSSKSFGKSIRTLIICCWGRMKKQKQLQPKQRSRLNNWSKKIGSWLRNFNKQHRSLAGESRRRKSWESLRGRTKHWKRGENHFRERTSSLKKDANSWRQRINSWGGSIRSCRGSQPKRLMVTKDR